MAKYDAWLILLTLLRMHAINELHKKNKNLAAQKILVILKGEADIPEVVLAGGGEISQLNPPPLGFLKRSDVFFQKFGLPICY